MITEVLQQLGAFEIPLKVDVSNSVSALVKDGFRHVVITNDRRLPHIQTDDVRIGARYVGVIDLSSRESLNGSGLNWYLSDSEGRGYPADEDIYLEEASLSQWISALIPPTLTIGTITTSPSPLVVKSWTGTWRRLHTSRRDAIKFVCDLFGVEWSISTLGVMDVGPVDTLYGADPTVLVSRDLSGNDRTVRALYAPDLAVKQSWEDWYTDLYVIWFVDDDNKITTDEEKGHIRSPVQSRANTSNWYDMQGNPVRLARFAERPNNMGDWAVASWSMQELMKAQEDNQLVDPGTKKARMIGVRGGDPTNVQVGQWVMVWDPEQGIVDPYYPVDVLGQRIFPWVLRCSTLTWAPSDGQGVYLWRNKSGTIASVDITDICKLEPVSANPSVGFSEV